MMKYIGRVNGPIAFVPYVACQDLGMLVQIFNFPLDYLNYVDKIT